MAQEIGYYAIISFASLALAANLDPVQDAESEDLVWNYQSLKIDE